MELQVRQACLTAAACAKTLGPRDTWRHWEEEEEEAGQMAAAVCKEDRGVLGQSGPGQMGRSQWTTVRTSL